MRSLLKFLLTVIVALCIIVACFSPWGFLAAFEPGQERYHVIYAITFVTAIVTGITAQRFRRKL